MYTYIHKCIYTYIHIYVAGLPYTVKYNTVTVGPEPPLVVLIHARGWQG